MAITNLKLQPVPRNNRIRYLDIKLAYPEIIRLQKMLLPSRCLHFFQFSSCQVGNSYRNLFSFKTIKCHSNVDDYVISTLRVNLTNFFLFQDSHYKKKQVTNFEDLMFSNKMLCSNSETRCKVQFIFELKPEQFVERLFPFLQKTL